MFSSLSNVKALESLGLGQFRSKNPGLDCADKSSCEESLYPYQHSDANCAKTVYSGFKVITIKELEG